MSEHKKKLRWIANRLKEKYYIPHKQTTAVLGAIADLRWNWQRSKYDLYGLDIGELLEEFGKERCPPDRMDDLA